MNEFDYTNTSNIDKLSMMVDDLTPEEAEAAVAAIKDIRKDAPNKKAEEFKKWFDAAFLPILKDFAQVTASSLKIEQDAHDDIIATLTSKFGFDITVNQKLMHSVVSAADHISVTKWTNADEIQLTLIFGLPEDED